LVAAFDFVLFCHRIVLFSKGLKRRGGDVRIAVPIVSLCARNLKASGWLRRSPFFP
jgi:hypothetical protein